MRCDRYFAVRDMTTGLWLEKNQYRPTWSPAGAVWRGTGPLRSFFTMLRKCAGVEPSPLWEVVEYELVEVSRVTAAVMATPPKKGRVR